MRADTSNGENGINTENETDFLMGLADVQGQVTICE